MKYDTFLVPFDIYQKLKEIGYDGQGLVSDRYTLNTRDMFGGEPNYHEFELEDFEEGEIPTYEQVFAWFREKKLIGIVSTKRITNNRGFEYCGFIDDLRIGGKINYIEDTPSYESARLNVLNKLIEMYEKKDKTFEFTGETLLHNKVTLNRIRAIVDIPEADVKKGDIGGWIEKEDNLFGNAWVYDDSKVYGEAKVYDNAKIKGGSEIRDSAKVFGDANIKNKSVVKYHASVFGNVLVNMSEVGGTSTLYGNAVITDESKIGDYACVHEDAFIVKSSVYGYANVSGKVIVEGNSAVYDMARVSGKVEISGRSYVCGEVSLSGEIKISDEARIY